jgi:hypothetical protein
MKRAHQVSGESSKHGFKREEGSAGSSVEALERRVFLSGNVLAQVTNGSLDLEGDAAGNVIFMNETRLKAHQVRIFGDNSTTINSQSGSVILNGVKGDVMIRMNGGADTVSLNDMSFPGNLRISQGALDTLTLDNVDIVRSLSLRNSTTQLTTNTTLTDTTVGKSFAILSGDGGQNIVLQGLQVHGDTGIIGGKRANTVKIDDSIFRRDFALATGRSVDAIQFETNGDPSGPTTQFIETASVSMGDGDDTLDIGIAGDAGNHAVFSGATNFDGEAGNDTLNAFNATYLTAPVITNIESDFIAPTVSSTDPAVGATAVATNLAIAATFSEAMNAATVTAANVTVTGPGSTPVAGTVSYSGTTMTFTPTSVLAPNTLFTATITTGVKDVAGNPMASNFVWTFTTGAALDTTAPTVSSTDPASNATSVALNKAIAATFSEAMNPATITNVTYTLKGPGNTPIAGAVTLVGTTATFTPTNDLAPNTLFTATISTAATDLAGNALAVAKVWSFTTGTIPDTTAPSVRSTDPASGATGVSLNRKIAATFTEAMDPTTITTAHVTVTGPGSTAVVGTVNYVNKTMTFSPTSLLTASTLYTVTITTGAKDSAGNAMASNKVWNFTTGTTSDSVAPTVASTNPANAVTGVAINKTVNATFSEAMDPQTIAANFTLTGPGSTPVAGTVSYDAPNKIASFIPTSNLTASTTYTATIKGGVTGVTDQAGNALAVDKVWTFTTGTQSLPSTVNLGEATNFAIMAQAAVSGSGDQINGDVGLNPGSAQGIPPAEINGTVHKDDQAIIDAQTDLLAAYNNAVARSANVVTISGDIGGTTITPGLYKSTSSLTVGTGSTLTLDAQGDPNAIFVIQMGTTLGTGTGANVVLANGAKASNVFWQVGSSATFGPTTTFTGNVIAAISITVNTGSVIDGRLLAGANTSSGAVVVTSSTVTVPSA